MDGKADSIRKAIEERLLDPYDKSEVDAETPVAVIRAALMQEFMWQTYHKFLERNGLPEAVPVVLRLAEDEQRHQYVLACLNDRTETPLEKTVAMQAAYITRLAELVVNEPDEGIGAVYEYILGDHLTHHHQFSHKLAQKEGLSPLALAGFSERPGRAMDEQFIEIEGAPRKPYRRFSAKTLTKIHVRLALAAELAQREAYRVMSTLSTDKHLIMVYQQAAIVDNRHIAILRSLIDPKESALESAYLAELAEVAELRRAADSVPPGRIKAAFGDILDEDKLHMQSLSDLLESTGSPAVPAPASGPPVLRAAPDVDAVVAEVAGRLRAASHECR